MTEVEKIRAGLEFGVTNHDVDSLKLNALKIFQKLSAIPIAIRTIAIILFLVTLNFSVVYAHNWEMVYVWDNSYGQSSEKPVYIDTDSVVNVNQLIKFGEPYFQVIAKLGSNVFVYAFRMHEGTRYFYRLSLDATTENLIYTPSTAAQQRKMYNQLVDSGTARNIAREAARQKGSEFREANIRKLSNGIITYGLNEKGALNPIGVYLLFRLVDESPQQTAQILQQLPFATDFGVVLTKSIDAAVYDAAFRYAIIR